MTTTEAPLLTEAEAHDALARARADHAAAQSEVETLRSLAEQGKQVDTHDFAAAKVADELTALRVVHADAQHTEATERANHDRREAWADSVRPTIEALDVEAIAAANKFRDAARALVAAVKVREDTVDRLIVEANGVGQSDRIECNYRTGVKVDWYPLRHYQQSLLSEVAPAICAIFTSAGQPGQADSFRIAHSGTGLPRPKDDK